MSPWWHHLETHILHPSMIALTQLKLPSVLIGGNPLEGHRLLSWSWILWYITMSYLANIAQYYLYPNFAHTNGLEIYWITSPVSYIILSSLPDICLHYECLGRNFPLIHIIHYSCFLVGNIVSNFQKPFELKAQNKFEASWLLTFHSSLLSSCRTMGIIFGGIIRLP